MAIRDTLAEYRRATAAKQGDQQDEFLRQLGFMATYQRQPYAQEAQRLQFPRRQQAPSGPSDAEMRARQKDANDAAAEGVEAQLLQAKLGQQPKGRVGRFLDRWIEQGMNQLRAGNADAAYDPSLVQKYENVERARIGGQMPEIGMSPDLAAAAAYSDDVKGLVGEMSGPGRQEAIEKQVQAKSKLFQERSKQLASLLDPTSSPTAATMAMKNGMYGGLGVAAGSAIQRGDKDGRKLMQDPPAMKATLQAMELVQQHGIDNLRSIFRGREVPVTDWKNPQRDPVEMERGLREFGSPFKLGDDTWSFGVEGSNPQDLKDLQDAFAALQSGDIGASFKDDKGNETPLIDTALSAKIPENVRWLVRQYKDDKGQLKQIGQALVSELSGIPSENVSGVARVVAQEWAKEMRQGGKKVFLVRHGEGPEDRRPIYVGNDAWKKLGLSQAIKTDGHFQGQKSLAAQHGLGEAQIEAAERFIKSQWKAGAGPLEKRVEPEIRFVLRSMNLPDAEIDGILQEGMPPFWQSWIKGGYGQLPESAWNQVRDQKVLGTVNEFLKARSIAQRPGAEASGPAKTRQVIEEHEAMKAAIPPPGSMLGGGAEPRQAQTTMKDQGQLPMSEDNPMGPPNFPDAGGPRGSRERTWLMGHSPDQLRALRREAEATWPKGRRTSARAGGPHTVK